MGTKKRRISNWFRTLALFKNFEAKRAKTAQKIKKRIFSKCVLDLNFAPIKGSDFLIFF